MALLVCLGTSVTAASAPRDDDRERKPEKPYALIFGTVWGPDDHPVYGVHVLLRRANEKKVRWHGYSDHNGEFAFRVPAGHMDYVVSIDLKGYKFPRGKELRAADDLAVKIENDERADIGVHLKR